jgi:type VI secretion system protein ImpJ
MSLAQHHFQLQNRYFEDALQFAFSHLAFQPYGLTGLELDAEALGNGTVSIVHARGIMPDGLAFNFPEDDPVPAPLAIGGLFSPTQDSHTVQLTVPAYRPGQPNCVMEPGMDGADRRFLMQPTFVRDETTGRDEREVTLGRKNFRLSLTADEGVALPLARVRRDRAGHFIYDERYIPPCLQIGASSRLVALVTRLVDMLDARSEAMLQDRKAERKGVAEYASHEVANFWLAHTIHSSLAPLRYHRDTRGTHPERLYVELARLAGALCTFALESHPRAVPGYDPDRLDDCFDALEAHIRAHLEVIVPTSYLTVPLVRQADYLHVGAISDPRSFGASRWILGVRCGLGEAETITRVPQLVKVCSERHILRLVKEAYAGLTLEHLIAPPAAIAPRVGTQYFAIHRAGPCWEAIQKTGHIGIYVPEAFPNLELDLRIQLQA